ncbi:MAG: amino acid ABC transporter permease [Bacillota bacterium]
MYSFNLYDVAFLLKGFLVTILLCLGTMALSLPGAVLVGLFRSIRSKNPVIAGIKLVLDFFISAVRGTPLMLLLMFLFFGLPFMNINMSPLAAALVGLAVYSIAYIAEIIRTGIESIAQDQWDGAATLGFNYLQTMRVIILPQAVRIMLPPAVGFFIGLIKDSSLTAVIGFVELARVGRVIVEKTHQSLLVFSIVALLYFIICYPLSMMTQRMEKALKN